MQFGCAFSQRQNFSRSRTVPASTVTLTQSSFERLIRIAKSDRHPQIRMEAESDRAVSPNFFQLHPLVGAEATRHLDLQSQFRNPPGGRLHALFHSSGSVAPRKPLTAREE